MCNFKSSEHLLAVQKSKTSNCNDANYAKDRHYNQQIIASIRIGFRIHGRFTSNACHSRKYNYEQSYMTMNYEWKIINYTSINLLTTNHERSYTSAMQLAGGMALSGAPLERDGLSFRGYDFPSLIWFKMWLHRCNHSSWTVLLLWKSKK